MPLPNSPRAVNIFHVLDSKCEPQVRTASAIFNRWNHSWGGWGEGGVICEMVSFVNPDHQIDCKLKTKIANTILLHCYLDKICLILTGGLWQASANLYSRGRL
jgi:hypothetical protein